MNDAFDVMLITPEERDELSVALFVKDGGPLPEIFRVHDTYWVEFHIPDHAIRAKLNDFKAAFKRAEDGLKDRLES